MGEMWGECLKKAKGGRDTQETDEKGFFAWPDECCKDFEPRKTPISQSDRRS